MVTVSLLADFLRVVSFPMHTTASLAAKCERDDETLTISMRWQLKLGLLMKGPSH